MTTQTATSATELLVSNDILSLNVLLGNLVKNPLVAHAAIYSVDNRILAEAGQRPKNGILGEAQGLYEIKITFQDTMAGHLRISLDMSQFQQPMTISLQSMGILAGILLALALALSLRLGRHISTPLMQMRISPEPEPEPLPEPDAEYDSDEDDEPYLEPEEKPAPTVSARTPAVPAPPVQRRIVAEEDEEDEEDPFADLREHVKQYARRPSRCRRCRSERTARQRGAGCPAWRARRLPRARLTELLQRYRDCLDQAASLYEGELHTLNDGSTLMLFHSHESGEDYLTNAICCGELLRALSHALQIEVADSGITLQLQLGLTLGENLSDLSQIDLLLTETAQDALALSQHSRNLLLVERRINDDPLIRQRARIRPIASPEGACCVERLMEPYPSMLERQLSRMHETNKV